MTVKTMGNGKKIIAWEPGDEIDWTTPDAQGTPGDDLGHTYCGNCGWDVPGCGCPRDCETCRELRGYCGHLGEFADGGELS